MVVTILTFLMVMLLTAIAYFNPRPNKMNYWIAGFALIGYGFLEVSTLNWLTLLFVVAGIVCFVHARYVNDNI